MLLLDLIVVRRTSRPICDNHPNRRRLWQALGMSNGSNSDGSDTDRQRLLAVARRLLRTEADAEDAVQDAYLRATRARQHAPESMQAWLHTVVRNLAIDRIRRERLQRTYLESCAAEGLLGPDEAESSLEHTVAMRQQCMAALTELLRRVGLEEAAVILLREVFEADYSDIARAAGKTVAASRQLVHRALARAHRALPSAKRHENTSDDDTATYVSLCWNAIQSRNPAVLFAMIAASPVAACALKSSPALGARGAPRTSCELVQVQGRYAMALMLDGVLLCVVPVGITAEDAPQGEARSAEY
jgi:RNA polymerase sigma factor (sigma-70 family)